MDKRDVTAASEASETHQVALPSWIDRIAVSAELVRSDLVLLMPDDDELDARRLPSYQKHMRDSPETTLAGGPWLPVSALESRLAPHQEAEMNLEVFAAPWDYKPWLFYGIYRTRIFQAIGRRVIPATRHLALQLGLPSRLSHHRLTELAVVLSAQAAGPTCVGARGLWVRNANRTWRSRLALWEGHLELEQAVLSEGRGMAVSNWSAALEEALESAGVSSAGILSSPQDMLISWAHSAAQARSRYPEWSVPILRSLGRRFS
jgi:hypothetical protein